MRLTSRTRNAILESVDKIYDRKYTNYISPKQYEIKLKNGYRFDPIFRTDRAEDKIEKLLKGMRFVTCGYMATSIRGYHTSYIIWKP